MGSNAQGGRIMNLENRLRRAVPRYSTATESLSHFTHLVDKLTIVGIGGGKMV
jgi:hypothetical protein